VQQVLDKVGQVRLTSPQLKREMVALELVTKLAMQRQLQHLITQVGINPGQFQLVSQVRLSI
jgi:hypothetical protein